LFLIIKNKGTRRTTQVIGSVQKVLLIVSKNLKAQEDPKECRDIA